MTTVPTIFESQTFPIKVKLAGGERVMDRVHLMGRDEWLAIHAAIAAGRPLLVRGEPGIGKSQMARAAARLLGRVFIKHVIDSRSESRDLLYHYDAVRRLADAQVVGALGESGEAKWQEVQARLDLSRYVQPGPLWWAFDWDNARQQAEKSNSQPPPQPDGGAWQQGAVLLLDEIDKAESELPNGLLEALGNRSFTPLGQNQPVSAGDSLPLVIITTNEERALPDAFMRRCLVLRLGLPGSDGELKSFLVARGEAHFNSETSQLAPKVLQKAAELLARHRRDALKVQVTPLPGQAEYLDLLRAVLGLSSESEQQLELLEQVGEFTLKKNMAWDGSSTASHH
ncbi:MAG: MoxR family ATPase [Magnetococcales bacterium]|nr:MoxR family ATPase [Magnetococcales bacterium]